MLLLVLPELGPLKTGLLVEHPVLSVGVQWSRTQCVYGQSTCRRHEVVHNEALLIILDETDGLASSSASFQHTSLENAEVPRVHSHQPGRVLIGRGPSDNHANIPPPVVVIDTIGVWHRHTQLRSAQATSGIIYPSRHNLNQGAEPQAKDCQHAMPRQHRPSSTMGMSHLPAPTIVSGRHSLAEHWIPTSREFNHPKG